MGVSPPFGGCTYLGPPGSPPCMCEVFVPRPEYREANPADDPRARIKARLAELEKVYASYLHYQEWRVKERDHHGAWDVAVNLSETECEMAGLRYALEALEGT